MLTDTITAISTANGTGAISVIRVSGEDAFDIAGKLTRKDFSGVKGNTVHYATIFDGEELVDEVLISFFRHPHSFTGEDVAEISCHGGVYLTRKVLGLVLARGARMAERGEFTQRAFLNGKMDLAQAEAVNDLIFARDEINARSAVHSLKGSVTKILDPLEEDLVQIISNIEVNIDYPEYEDVHELTEEEVLPKSREWLEKIGQLIRRAEEANTIREGIDTVILGKPNVGKSSLLNALLEEDKAIVTEIAGTTRDLVEGSVRLGDITLNLIDTAGIRESDDKVEQIGIEKSIKALEKAQLVIVVIDANNMDEQDEELLRMTENRNRIVVYNKKDKKQIDNTIAISAIQGDIDALVTEIQRLYERELSSAHMDTLNNERQIGLAKYAKLAMEDAVRSLEEGMELDLVTIDLQKAYDALKEIRGNTSREDLLDEIFSRFCLGK
ncbi:MAG: tRNA uridine-5-carboxymethylaminomethyl(34) synthesis GTPase MnmE [Solobacterium sp.]|nr:tRNA uridine-5-carboxymethylaminomethyl(34) synthesis GTPase MnmE [Solobacterium sp.]